MPQLVAVASAGRKSPSTLIAMVDGGYSETHGYNWFSGLCTGGWRMRIKTV